MSEYTESAGIRGVPAEDGLEDEEPRLRHKTRRARDTVAIIDGSESIQNINARRKMQTGWDKEDLETLQMVFSMIVLVGTIQLSYLLKRDRRYAMTRNEAEK